MFQRCHMTDVPRTSTEYHDVGEGSSSSAVGTAPPISECERRPFDLVQKRSGLHNLTRCGYDEEKCLNVLVRYCAHIPRNFQYKDGIQQADLELPHIPHMTTITSSIVPTERLLRWRSEHADRYRFVLSDSSPMAKRDCIDSSCVRNKKAWLIDHTLFVSTPGKGTRPMWTPNPREFHEMQWDPDYGVTGRFVEERELPIASLDRSSEASPPSTADTSRSPKSRSQRLRHSLSRISIIEKLVEKLGKQKKDPETKQRRRSWVPNFESSSLFKDQRAHCGTISVPLPEGCQIPNAIFARKFLLVDNGETLPTHMPISQMPTAESKATETIVEAATTGLLNQASPWLFRGPFTPQLGFDGGLDYQWSSQDAGIAFRRFDLEAPLLETPYFDLDCSSRGGQFPGYDTHVKSRKSSSKRRARVFDLEYAADVKTRASTRGKLDEASLCRARDEILPQSLPTSAPYASNKSLRSGNKITDISSGSTSERREKQNQNEQLFDNIEFKVQIHDFTTSRQGGLKKLRNSAKNQPTSPPDLQAGNATRTDRQETTREFLLSNIQEVCEFRADAANPRQVSHGVTGEILQPLTYNPNGQKYCSL
ncbi:hypothetical protein FHL15_008641 [Xylaria flabelliformis]|uniref:Uncharacterized protein n=1 Tax=Xylaria flabelliformis TaxID=2512241 RepID=A0A553HRA6_9PEZI|nr:hypothetical protein FHL15_008641 [Xylaria flabelliformis]